MACKDWRSADVADDNEMREFSQQMLHHAQNQQMINFMTGSFAELDDYGVDITDGSLAGMNASDRDIDVMWYDANRYVFASRQPVPETYKGQVIRYYTEGMHPGYVHLIDEVNGTLLANTLTYLDKPSGENRRQGPAVRNNVSEKIEKELTGLGVTDPGLVARCSPQDHVLSFHSPRWPDEAAEWINRTRRHGSPSKPVIRKVASYGCDFVCVAHKLSPNRDHNNEWRFSFSKAELIIIRSWTMGQKIVYRALRFLYKAIQDTAKEHNLESNLCTYYFKTLMLWASEKRPKEFWDEDSIVASMLVLLKEMSDWLTTKLCSNYFIPSNNMMDHFSDVNIPVDLISALEEYYKFSLEKENSEVYELAEETPINRYRSAVSKVNKFVQTLKPADVTGRVTCLNDVSVYDVPGVGLARDIAALNTASRSPWLIASILEMFKKEAMDNGSTTRKIELPTWIQHSLIIFDRLYTNDDLYRQFFSKRYKHRFEQAAYAELYNVFNGLHYHQLSVAAACSSNDVREDYWRKAMQYFSKASSLHETSPCCVDDITFDPMMMESFFISFTADITECATPQWALPGQAVNSNTEPINSIETAKKNDSVAKTVDSTVSDQKAVEGNCEGTMAEGAMGPSGSFAKPEDVTSSSNTLYTGLAVSSASNAGLAVSSASNAGLAASSDDDTGLVVSSASNAGLVALSASNAGLAVSSASNAGLAASSASNTGLAMSRASNTGLLVSSASNAGLAVSSASNAGLAVSSASNAGLAVSSASNAGLAASSASNTGLAESSASNTGLAESSASNAGLAALSTAFSMYIMSRHDDGKISTKRKLFRHRPTMSPTVSISWFIAKVYTANFLYTVKRDYQAVKETCDNAIAVYEQSTGNRSFAEKGFPIMLTNQWASIYDDDIQVLIGFYSLCLSLSSNLQPHNRFDVYLKICPYLFAVYLKWRCSVEHQSLLDYQNCMMQYLQHAAVCKCDPGVKRNLSHLVTGVNLLRMRTSKKYKTT